MEGPHALENAYVAQVAMIRDALANLTEFAESLPAPNEDGKVPQVDWATIDVLGAIRQSLGEAARNADHLWD